MEHWEAAVHAAQSKKAEDIAVLDIGAVSSFAEHFLICSASNPRQTLAISEGIEEDLRERGVRPIGVEGRPAGEWVLMDYGDFIVHIFAPEKREFYGLERLWRNAPRLPVPEAA